MQANSCLKTNATTRVNDTGSNIFVCLEISWHK